MCEVVKDFPVIGGGDKILTLQDLIDRTPKELISKVTLEEKVFKTWYSCRTVLIGDGKCQGLKHHKIATSSFVTYVLTISFYFSL